MHPQAKAAGRPELGPDKALEQDRAARRSPVTPRQPSPRLYRRRPRRPWR